MRPSPPPLWATRQPRGASPRRGNPRETVRLAALFSGRRYGRDLGWVRKKVRCAMSIGPWPSLTLTPDILPIFYCNKGGRGENILRNIVGNKGWLGGGYYTIMCNNAPFPRAENRFFFQTSADTSIHPKSDP